MQKFKLFFKNNYKKKRFWVISGIVLIILLSFIFRPNTNAKNTTTDIAKYSDLKETVLATGQVISNTDIDLSFTSSGTVDDIKVKVGDNVKKGAVLASLDGDSEKASLTSARGTLLAAQAKQKRLEEGTELGLARISLENAMNDLENTKIVQDTLVKNAYHNLLNSTPEAVPDNDTSDYEAPTISGSYTLGKEGTINLKIYRSSGGYSYEVSGLVTGGGKINYITPQPVGNTGLFIRFADEDSVNSIDEWKIEIPNKKATNYLSNFNAYESALKTKDSTIANAQALVKTKQAEYDFKVISSSGSELDFAKAEVLSAEGNYEQALAKYNNTLIIAPADGTITSIDIKIGRQINAGEEAIVLEDVSNMYLEANINEANISSLKEGMPIEVTFDAFGIDKIYKGNIKSIDLSSTLVGGVVNYKIEASIEQVEGLKPGMTANMTILANEKNHIIAIPSRAVITNKDGEKVVRLVTDTKRKKWKEVKVETGMMGDGGIVEISSGLYEGEEYVVLIKSK